MFVYVIKYCDKEVGQVHDFYNKHLKAPKINRGGSDYKYKW